MLQFYKARVFKLSGVLAVASLFMTPSASADWIFGRASTAKKAKTKMLGMSKEQVLECMGAPAEKATVGATEVWTYHSGGDASVVGAGAQVGRSPLVVGGGKSLHRYCDVNVVMKSDTVKKLNYVGRTGGLVSGDEQCAFAVQNCID